MDSVVWAPDGRLAYQTSDQRNYYLLDPESGNEQRLGSTDTGWMFYPRFSPDRSRVAVYWNRRPSGPALWTIDLKTRTETFIAGGIVPVGWSPDNRVIYGVRSPAGEPEIIRVDLLTGTQSVLARFPSGVVESGSVSRDGVRSCAACARKLLTPGSSRTSIPSPASPLVSAGITRRLL
jgi:Tol biopolymer transport system component